MSRITLLSMNRNVLANTQSNLSRVAAYQEQLSSGKRVNKMSDDPIAARRALMYRSEQDKVQKFMSNINKSLTFMEASDSAMSEMVTLFDDIKEVAVTGANATQDENSRKALASSVSSQLDRLLDLTNSVHDGRYLFAGTASTTKPFNMNADRDNVLYKGDMTSYEVNLNFSSKSIVNQNGYDLWKSEVDVFDVVIELRTALEDNDPVKVTELIGSIDKGAAHINDLQGQLGGRMQRLQLTERQLQDTDLHLGSLISDSEDVDMAETVMNMQTAQIALEASLQTGARVIQPSLLDYL